MCGTPYLQVLPGMMLVLEMLMLLAHCAGSEQLSHSRCMTEVAGRAEEYIVCMAN